MVNIPGFSGSIHRASLADGGAADPKFFRYTMPKLASSHAHIQPLKKGRAMCEIFGAFGWCEGPPYMKALTDSMLIAGINHMGWLLELKDKMGGANTEIDFSAGVSVAAPAAGNNAQLATAALQELGYSPAEIATALKGVGFTRVYDLGGINGYTGELEK